MREQITLACTETGDRNYITTKNKRTNPERLELKKYSPRLKNIRYIVKRSKTVGSCLLFFLYFIT